MENETHFGAPSLGDETEQSVEVPMMEQRHLPQYRTQAQITAEIRRRAEDLRMKPSDAMFAIAQEWSPYTNYHPRRDTAPSTIKRTLVQRIGAVLGQQGAVGSGRRVRRSKN